jgi:hypothetical protein
LSSRKEAAWLPKIKLVLEQAFQVSNTMAEVLKVKYPVTQPR